MHAENRPDINHPIEYSEVIQRTHEILANFHPQWHLDRAYSNRRILGHVVRNDRWHMRALDTLGGTRYLAFRRTGISDLWLDGSKVL